MNASDSSIDRMVVSMERALAGLGRTGDVTHRIANQNLLLCLIHARLILLDVLEDSAGDCRARLVRSFGSEFGRIARIRAVSEEIVMQTPPSSGLGSEFSARLAAAQQCIAACDSVDTVLNDKGGIIDVGADCSFFDIFTPRDVVGSTDMSTHGAYNRTCENHGHMYSGSKCLDRASDDDMAARRPFVQGANCLQGGGDGDHISDLEHSASAGSTSASICLEHMDGQECSSSQSSTENTDHVDDSTYSQRMHIEMSYTRPRCDASPSPVLPTLLPSADKAGAVHDTSRRMRRGTHFNSLKCMFSHGPGYSCPGCIDQTREVLLPF